jgi:putative acetyltransferase
VARRCSPVRNVWISRAGQSLRAVAVSGQCLIASTAQRPPPESVQTVAMAVRVRGARDEDLTSLLPIWRAAVEASHGFLTSEDVDWYEKLVAGYLPQMGDLRVAVDADDAPLGFIAQDAGEIHMLFVSPDFQGRGVGSALLEDVAQDQPELRLDVNEQNPAALAFYTAKGFEQVGRSEVDGQGRPFPLLHLARVST